MKIKYFRLSALLLPVVLAMVFIGFGQIQRPIINPLPLPIVHQAPALDWTDTELWGSNYTLQLVVKIKADTAEGQFNDSIYMTPDDWANCGGTDDLAAQVQARIDNWVGFIQAAKSATPVQPTTDDLIAQQSEMQTRMDNLLQQIIDSGATDEQINAITAAMSAKVATLKVKK